MPRYKNYIILTTILRIISDAVVLYLSFLLAFWGRFYSGFFSTPLGIPPLTDYTEAFFVVTLLFILVFNSFGLYNPKRIFKSSREISLLFKAVSMGVLIVMAITFVHRGYSYSRLVVPFSWFFGIVGLILSRYIVGNIEPWLCEIRNEYKKVLILGTDQTAFYLQKKLRKNSRWGYKIIGFLSEKEVFFKDIKGFPVFGDLSMFSEILDREKPDEVILTITGLSHDKMIDLILESEKRLVGFKLVPDMFEMITSKVDVFNVDGISLLGITELPLEATWNRMMKRTFDVVGAISGLIISVPFFVIIPALIKFTSKGPVFYNQDRCGEDGNSFTLIKFRTMNMDAESKTGPVWAKDDDPRCTVVGKWLRVLMLDEIPQLINVLKGDMSLVGPRPERPHFVEQFKNDIPRYMSRHLIKSGMTGWAQVSGYRGNTPLKDRIKYDMYYIENWSIPLDIKIIFMTLFRRKKVETCE